MQLPKAIIVLAFLIVPAGAFAEDTECDDVEYRGFVEELNCSCVLSTFRSFLDKARIELNAKHPTNHEEQSELIRLVDQIEHEEESVGHCLVKHADSDARTRLVEIYIAATAAALSLRRWIESRPDEEFFERRARAKFEELQRALDEKLHNNAFNTDAGKACAG